MSTVQKNITLLKLYKALICNLFVLPVLLPFCRDSAGVDYKGLMISEAAFCAVMVLMEVPSGWIADIWTRKKTMLVATGFHVLGWVILWQGHGLFMVVASQMILGIAVSLISGTDSALLYETMLEAGAAEKYQKEESKLHGLNLYICGASALAGGFLYEMNHDLPVVLTALTSLLSFIPLAFIREPERVKIAVRKHPVADIIETVRYTLHGHAEIGGIVLLSAILFAGTKNLTWTQQPYFILLDLPEAWFGIFMAVGFLVGGTGGYFGHLLSERVRNIDVLIGCMIVAILSAVVAGLFPSLWCVPLLLTGTAIFGLGRPRLQAAINRRVESGRRATILSTASLAVNMICGPLMVLIGYTASAHGIAAGLLTLGGVLTAGFIVAFILLRGRMAGIAAMF